VRASLAFNELTWHPSNFGKRRKMAYNRLANQLGKNANLAKLMSPRGTRVDPSWHRRGKPGERVKK
jgi:hypothetical protein